jgi:hypothetical protein
MDGDDTEYEDQLYAPFDVEYVYRPRPPRDIPRRPNAADRRRAEKENHVSGQDGNREVPGQNHRVSEVFTIFTKLPRELQIEIWKQASQLPRVFEMVTDPMSVSYITLSLTLPSRLCPAILSTCNLSRSTALESYKKTCDPTVPFEIYINPSVDIAWLRAILQAIRSYSNTVTAHTSFMIFHTIALNMPVGATRFNENGFFRDLRYLCRSNVVKTVLLVVDADHEPTINHNVRPVEFRPALAAEFSRAKMRAKVTLEGILGVIRNGSHRSPRLLIRSSLPPSALPEPKGRPNIRMDGSYLSSGSFVCNAFDKHHFRNISSRTSGTCNEKVCEPVSGIWDIDNSQVRNINSRFIMGMYS